MSCCNSNCNHDPCGSSFNQALTRAAQYAQYAQTQANKAEDLWLEFNALYLGAFAVAPTQDNQGNPLQVGALYWNTASNELYTWNGLAWVTATGFNEFTPFLSTGSTAPRNLATRMADVVNVKDFGAVGDGVADDTAAVQAAINSITTNNGAEIYFPQGGTYKLGTVPIIVQKSNITFNFNYCNIINNNLFDETIFEIYPTSLNQRKALQDYPSSWYVGGSPYSYEGDWRTMMFDPNPANRLRNITIKNCFTDSNFEGIMFQIFSVDGVYAFNNNMRPGLHAAIRVHHCSDIEYKNNVFGGTGVYGLFFFKCRRITMQNNNFLKSGVIPYSIKGVYHGTGSIFAACTPGFTDVGIKISNNVHIIENATPNTQFGRIDVAGGSVTINQDVIGQVGGTPIGFTKLEWVGPGAKNIVVTENTYKKDTPTKTLIFGILLPSENVTISRNNALYGCIFVAGGEGVYIEDNIFEYDPLITTDDTAPISVRPDGWIFTQPLPNNGKICRNTIKNPAAVFSGEDTTAIKIVGTNFDISGNRLEFPRAGVQYIVNIDNASADYITGNDNLIIAGASSVVDPNQQVRTASGANLNGGSVFSSLVDTVSGVQNAYTYKGFGDQLNVVGLTTAGTVTIGGVASNYTLLNDLCFIQVRISWTNLTGTGDLAITGLPFLGDNRESGSYQYLLNISANNLTYTGSQLIAYVTPNENQIRIAQFSSAGTITGVPCDSAGTIFISGFYPYKFQ